MRLAASNHQRSKPFFFHSIKMENLALEELRAIVEMRNIGGYERMSKERLITSINELKPVKKNLMMQEQKRTKEILINQDIEILSQKL